MNQMLKMKQSRVTNKKRHFSKARAAMLFLIVLIIVQLFILFDVHLPVQGSEVTKDVNLQEVAVKVITTCKTAKYRPTCYDTEIPKLMDTLSMENAFAVAKIVQDQDTSYTYCHVLGHKLSAQEVRKDPSKWKEVVTRCPSGVCSNGCIHGGFQEKFRKQMFTDEDIATYKPDLKGICEDRSDWHPTGIEQASCYHAIGHLTMYITNGEIQRALPLCDEIARKPGGRDYSVLCYDGAFMQIFQPLEFDDFAIVEGKQPPKESVYEFCSGFNPVPAAQASCINESWPLFKEEIMTPRGFLDHCAHIPTDYGRNYCYIALSYIVTPKLGFDPEKTAAFCDALPDTARTTCLINGATRIIENDTRHVEKAAKLCAIEANATVASRCFQELATRSSYYLGKNTANQHKLCSLLPSEWHDRCMQ